MIYFDEDKLTDRARATAARLDLDSISIALESPAFREAAQELIDLLNCGVLLWDSEGQCELVSRNVSEFLELEEFDLKVGTKRDDLLRHMIDLGFVHDSTLEEIKARYNSGRPFEATRMIPSGREIRLDAQPRTCGGHVLTLHDVTAMREREKELSSAKTRAEDTARKLSAEIARLNSEKARVEERQEELQRLSLVAAHAKDLIVITNATAQIIWANEAYRRYNGLDLEMDLIGKSHRDVLTGPDTNPAHLASIDDAVRHRQALTIEVLCYRRTGESYWMEQEIIPVFNEEGEHTNFIIVGRDISERKAAEVAANEARRFENSKRAESRLLAEFNEWLQSSDTLDEVFVVVSSFLAKLLPGGRGAVYTYGASRDVLSRACHWGGETEIHDFEPADCWALRRGRAYYFGENTVDIACSHVQLDENGALPARQYCLPIIAHGDTVGLLSIAMDETAGQDSQKLANFCAEHISLAIANVKLREQLREQSTRDPLTGLYNRRFFMDYARREITRCKAQGRPGSFISLDVDYFKSFNDTYGHDVGDLVLKSLAGVLQNIFREADVPCRIGGEEFVVMLPGADKAMAMERAEQLRAAVELMEVPHGGETLKITMSAGVCEYPSDGASLGDLMTVVDKALYQAKDKGRNCVVAC